MKSLALRVLPLILFLVGLRASDPHAISLRVTSGDTTTLHGFDSSGVVFLPIEEFCRALQLPYVQNDTTARIEILVASHFVRWTENNPFVAITERTTGSAYVYQLQRDVVRFDHRSYVSVDQFVSLLNGVVGGGITYADSGSILAVAPVSPNSRFDITGLTIEKKLNGYLMTLQSRRRFEEVETWLKPDGWLFITIPNARADTNALQQTKPFGVIKRILTFQSPTSVQLTFRVSSEVEQAEVSADPSSDNLLVSLRARSEPTPKVVLNSEARRESARRDLEKERHRWKLDVIVIDAGHGGKDPGTIGVSGVWEKKVTLSIALQLGKLIESNLKDVKVVYTRKTDSFIELYRRTKIANDAGGKLFISIHCNSMERKPSPARGLEIYLLRPGKTEEAITIASRENAVINLEENSADQYRKLTEEEFIMITMAQSAYMKHSESFAELAMKHLPEPFKTKSSGVKQAGFYVLVGASMPNVLVETGYLSNRQEEKILANSDSQNRIAEALFKGIGEYKREYEKALREGN
jgi:N-acetylmuramoyl-L-alanine amidase